MKYTYTAEHLEEYLRTNMHRLLKDPKFQALIVEVKSAEDAGSIFVNKTGHDEVHEAKGRIETKYTNYILPTGELRINSAGENKRDGFDLLRIIDGINHRIFEIPHDEYFSRSKRYGGEFRWSPSYNKYDRKQPVNTALLLDFEITE